MYESWDDPPIWIFFAWDLPPPFGGVPRVREGATAKEIHGDGTVGPGPLFNPPVAAL